MRGFIVSDLQPDGLKVRNALLREGADCPPGHVVTLDLAAQHVAQARPDLLVFVLPSDAERALALLNELRLLTQAPVLAVGPTADSRLVLRVLRGGASDYVDEADLETELRAALGRLRTEQPGQAEPGRTIAVLAPSGGSGSSTLAVNLATALAKEHKSSLLIDLKLETGDLAALLDLRPTHTLADLCQNAALMDRVMFERSLVKHTSGVQLLAAPRTFADIRHVNPQGISQTLALGRALFPYVVMDLDHSFREEQAQALRLSDVVLLVLRLDFTSLRNTRRALDYLAQLGVALVRVRVVVNRYGQAKEVPSAKAEEALRVRIAHYIPDDPKTVNRANNGGTPVVLESPSAKVSRSVVQLAASVNGRHSER
jgi:pilus assembly protein CpaE